MKRRRARFGLLAAAGLLLSLALLVGWSLWPRAAPKDWLWVSPPVFVTRGPHDGGGAGSPTVSFTISNAGPRSLEYWVYWLECRARADLTLLATNYGPGSLRGALTSGATVIFSRDLLSASAAGEERLFCCEIEWWESEPTLWRLGRKLEPLVSRALYVLNSQWVPPWVSGGSKPRAQGQAFTSNPNVADYFRLAYGWTRESWLEEMARLEAARTNAGSTQGSEFRRRYGAFAAPTTEELAKAEARDAFALYCRQSTNLTSAP